MKKHSITLILFLAFMEAIPRANAQSGPPPMQEVEATGQGADADAAFKQAVNDAVRQVVGTLVSAENVVNNERVIKDEVLTLSDGFVEKVLSQDKSKLDDGTWQVKLKCIVRKGQLYGKLQKANVPTIKFDGVSIFADVVSQSNFRQDAHKLLAKAVRNFFRQYPSIVKFECGKPEIVNAGDETTRVKIKFTPKVDEEKYYNVLLPPLLQVLKQSTKEIVQLRSNDFSVSGRPRFFTKVGNESDGNSISEVVVQERSGWAVYAIETEILKDCDPRYAFNDQAGAAFVGNGATLILFQKDDSSFIQIEQIPQFFFETGLGWVTAKPTIQWANNGTPFIEVNIPNKQLPSITKVTIHFGLNITAILENSLDGFFEESSKIPFGSDGWFVYNNFDSKLTIQRGFTSNIKSSHRNVYFLGDSLE